MNDKIHLTQEQTEVLLGMVKGAARGQAAGGIAALATQAAVDDGVAVVSLATLGWFMLGGFLLGAAIGGWFAWFKFRRVKRELEAMLGAALPATA